MNDERTRGIPPLLDRDWDRGFYCDKQNSNKEKTFRICVYKISHIAEVKVTAKDEVRALSIALNNVNKFKFKRSRHNVVAAIDLEEEI